MNAVQLYGVHVW